MGDDLVDDLLVGRFGHDLPRHELRLRLVRPAGDDLVGVGLTDAGQGDELGPRGGVQVEQGGLGWCRLGRYRLGRRGIRLGIERGKLRQLAGLRIS